MNKHQNIFKKLNEDLEIFLEDYYSSFIENNDDLSAYEIFQQFLEDKSNHIIKYQWQLIPAEQYHNALKMYMRDGADFKFPKRTLESWVNLICKNLTVLDIMSEIAGHSQWFPYDAFNDCFMEEGQEVYEYYKAYEILDNEGFYEWAVLPDGTDAISDYGIKPVRDILTNLSEFPSSEEMIIAINRCLDVFHQRGDLASAFIEGGAKSCSKISNENFNEEAMYKSNQQTFKDFYNYVIRNPKCKKCYFELINPYKLRIPSDTILHDYNKHSTKYEDWVDCITNLENIKKYSVSRKKLYSSNADIILLRIKGKFDYGCAIQMEKEYSQINTLFIDKCSKIDNWIETSSAGALTNKPSASLSSQDEVSVVLPSQNSKNIIQQIINKIKGLNEDLQDLILYHGSQNDFNSFELSRFGVNDKGWLGYGIYFTNDIEMAQSYADKIGSVLYTCKVDIKNPYIIQDRQASYSEDFLRNKLGIVGAKSITHYLKEQGYDSVMLTYDEMGDEFIEVCVFDTNNVKILSKSYRDEYDKFVNEKPEQIEEY